MLRNLVLSSACHFAVLAFDLFFLTSKSHSLFSPGYAFAALPFPPRLARSRDPMAESPPIALTLSKAQGYNYFN